MQEDAHFPCAKIHMQGVMQVNALKRNALTIVSPFYISRSRGTQVVGVNMNMHVRIVGTFINCFGSIAMNLLHQHRG